MLLRKEVGLGPGDIVLDEDPVPLKKGTQYPSPLCGPCLLWPNDWMDQDATWCGGRPRPGHAVLDGDLYLPSQKGHTPHFW